MSAKLPELEEEILKELYSNCELKHKQCRQTACAWRIEKLLKLEEEL